MTQMCSIPHSVLAIVLVGTFASQGTAQSVPTVTGSLHQLVGELTGREYFLRHPQKDPRPYIEPSFALTTLYRASRHIAGGNVDEAARLAKQVDCEVVRFVDKDTKQDYVLLREDLDTLTEPRGWGSYLYNPRGEVSALVEAPHPIDDSNSAKVASMVFAEGAKGLLLAGAQRDKADVPDLVDSVFHQVHVAWTEAMGRVAVWQIHGFALEKHPFPRNAKAILSTGGGDVIDEIVELNDRFTDRGLDSYAFNRLKPTNDLNKWVNQGTPGLRFSSLAATKNEQGKHLRSVGGTFVHVELERSVRGDVDQRRVAAEAIAEAMRGSADRKAASEDEKPPKRTTQRPRRSPRA
ncbi:hypothetical protein [Aeoliella sp.]|uniref:hypothetical protein n=1 Tax=Aeoliella sp. TaxID=2795800 RepID=UPI003CCC0D82